MMWWIAAALAANVCRGLDVRLDDPVGPELAVEGLVGVLELVDGKPRFRKMYYETGASDQAVRAGTEVVWVLDDATRVTMVTLEEVQPVFTYGRTRWPLQFVVDEDIVHAIARSKVARFRYTLVADPRDITPEHPQAIGLQRLFACFANQWTHR